MTKLAGEWWFSRARLRRDAELAALAPLLLAGGGAAHRLVWALFADGPARKRDFLWREEAPGRLLVLSPRLPVDAHGLFELESKPFAPDLAAGDRLGFSLRANPVVARSVGPQQRGPKGDAAIRRHDVVMDAIHGLPRDERAAARLAATQSAGQAWLARQGERHGFALVGMPAVDGYDRLVLPRQGAASAVLGVLDFAGALEVHDPECFLAAVTGGLGRGRAFGCGLMLIRRLAGA